MRNWIVPLILFNLLIIPLMVMFIWIVNLHQRESNIEEWKRHMNARIEKIDGGINLETGEEYR